VVNDGLLLVLRFIFGILDNVYIVRYNILIVDMSS